MSFLVTGGLGCLGAWTLYHLVQDGQQAICFDISDDRHRLDLLMSADEQAVITFVQGDLTDLEQLQVAFEKYDVTHVIHLAALQVPGCKANPPLGARVNVVGTVNVFEATLQTGIKHIAYASSIAVYGPPDDYPPGLISADAPMLPRTLYGVYKVANENTARIYWQDHNISSIVLRPYTVYGLGRDQGLTSEPTKAMKAAARGDDYHISFGGEMQFHFASDVAQQFIATAKQTSDGALGFNLGSAPVRVQQVGEIIMAICPDVTISVEEKMLPFPIGCDAQALYNAFEHVYETPLEQGIQQTIEAFRTAG